MWFGIKFHHFCHSITSLIFNVFNGCLQVGDESYDSFMAEKENILASLARRAKVSLPRK